jgi:riboflavin kinase / FMN adenylyltransferase
MEIYYNLENIRINKPIVTVGTFDGVHLGHQHIFNRLIKTAGENKGEPVVITFWPHPRMIVHPGGTEIMLLNTLEEKIALIKRLGIKHFIVLPFNKEFSQLSSTDFIEEYLYKKIGIKGLIIGYDHRFGKDRLGDSDQLKACAEKYGFFLQNVEAFCLNEEKISSTRIRNALLEGDVELANSFLSGNYSISGLVENGYKIGRDIGFPTANLRPDYDFKLVPLDGVYAVKVDINGHEYQGMLNIGVRPTVNKGNSNKSIEVHIIGFEGDLYDKKITLIFYKRIRNELKFKSIDELKNQLKADKEQVTAYFKNVK